MISRKTKEAQNNANFSRANNFNFVTEVPATAGFNNRQKNLLMITNPATLTNYNSIISQPGPTDPIDMIT